MVPKIIKNSENHRVLSYLINSGELTNVQAVFDGISYNLRSRISDLRKWGFDISDRRDKGKKFNYYYIPPEKLEETRKKMLKAVYG